jgi:hypothetical protein
MQSVLFEGYDMLQIDEVTINPEERRRYHDAADWVRSKLPNLVEIPCAGFGYQ